MALSMRIVHRLQAIALVSLTLGMSVILFTVYTSGGLHSPECVCTSLANESAN